MRVLEAYELRPEERRKCSIERCPERDSFLRLTTARGRCDIFALDLEADAFAYIRYRSSEGITEAFVDKRTYEYLLDCAIPVKEQFAAQIALLKSGKRQGKNKA